MLMNAQLMQIAINVRSWLNCVGRWFLCLAFESCRFLSLWSSGQEVEAGAIGDDIDVVAVSALSMEDIDDQEARDGGPPPADTDGADASQQTTVLGFGFFRTSFPTFMLVNDILLKRLRLMIFFMLLI